MLRLLLLIDKRQVDKGANEFQKNFQNGFSDTCLICQKTTFDG